MNQVLQNKGFYQFAKGLHLVFKILFILCIAAMIGIAAIAVTVFFISNDTLNQILNSDTLLISLSLQGISMQFSPEVVIDAVLVKRYFIILLLLSELLLAIGLFIVYQLKNFMGIIIEDTPFCQDSVKCIEKVAYGFIVFSFIIDSYIASIAFFIGKMMNLDQLVHSVDWIEGISYQFVGVNISFLVAGFVILLIANVFKYGVYLKEEHDATV